MGTHNWQEGRGANAVSHAEPTRILHFIDTLGAGGAERQLIYLLEGLDRNRYSPYVLTVYDEFRHYEPALKMLDIPLYSLHHGVLNARNRAATVWRYIRLLWELYPHIVHSWLHYPNLIARVARVAAPKHYLMCSIRTHYTPRQRRTEQWTDWLSDIRIVNHKNHQIRNTPTIKTIPNGIAESFFNTRKEVPLRSSPTALIPARIDPRKDHLTAIEALDQYNQQHTHKFHLTLLGEISDLKTQKRIEQSINRHGLHNFVHQTPGTKNVIPYYENAYITILPSTTEGSSNIILESLATGTPIIVSEAANNNQLIKNGENGWVFPTGNSNILAECLERASILSPEQYTQMSQRCRRTAAPFTTEAMISAYDATYQQLLNRSYRRS